jgi:flagellar protein FliS
MFKVKSLPASGQLYTEWRGILMLTYGQNQYRRTQVNTVDRGRLIILLYEGAISFLSKAQHSIQEDDIAGASVLINRAQDIIDELNAALNMELGGDIAQNLRRLYMFMNDQLVQAKIKADLNPLKEVVRMLSSLNDAWREAVTKPEAQEVLSKQVQRPLAQTINNVTI